jgi:hypothetical protein
MNCANARIAIFGPAATKWYGILTKHVNLQSKNGTIRAGEHGYVPLTPYPSPIHTQLLTRPSALPLLNGVPRRLVRPPTPVRRLCAGPDQELYDLAVGAVYKLQIRAHGAQGVGCECD